MSIIVQGIQYDSKSSFMQGPAEAPPMIRNILQNGAANFFAENGLEVGPSAWIEKGDIVPQDYFDIEQFTAKNLEEGGNIFTLGGDHSITFPVIKALTAVTGPVSILHIDAHADLYDNFEGDRYSHACPFARIMEEGLCRQLVQVGIRTLNPHQRDQAKKFNVEVHEMKDWSLDKLPRFDHPLYISLDMDGFDPACAPGVSHHEPGGFTARQVMDIIHKLDSPIVGADIVEYNPKRDIHDMTGALAAKMMKEIISKMIENG